MFGGRLLYQNYNQQVATTVLDWPARFFGDEFCERSGVEVAVPVRALLDDSALVRNWVGHHRSRRVSVARETHEGMELSPDNSYNFVGAFFEQNVFGPFTAKLDVYNAARYWDR